MAILDEVAVVTMPNTWRSYQEQLREDEARVAREQATMRALRWQHDEKLAQLKRVVVVVGLLLTAILLAAYVGYLAGCGDL